MNIERISKIESGSLGRLVDESLSQGFPCVDRLIREYHSGFNCFDKSGEILLRVLVQSEVVGIGGLNQDPYFKDPKVGRLRHLYVGSVWRRKGAGRLLVDRLIAEASQHCQLLTLRTQTLAADKFYQQLGFKTAPCWEHTTHHRQLSEVDYYPSTQSEVL